VGHHCFRGESVSSYRFLFLFCGIAYAGVAVAAYFVDNEHNRINRYYLDVRWPEAYVAVNPDGIKNFLGARQGEFRKRIGPDLAALLNDSSFIEVLHNGTFYKQHFDEPFQLLSRAVIYAYRPKSPSGAGRRAFEAIRFPKELADALRFEPMSEEK
jgi:hypothetical protein